MNKYLFLTFFLIGLSGFAQTKRTYYDDEALVPREHPVDFTHLRLEVAFEPTQGKVFGKVTHSFVVLQAKVDTLFLDAPDITIKKASLDGQNLNFTTSKAGVTLRFAAPLTWDNQHSIEIEYECKPKKGIYFIGWNDPKNLSRKQIWTQGQGIDNRAWIPHFDSQNDKITSEIIVRFDKNYKVLSNGDLISATTEGNITTWHYKLDKPHASYLIMLGIGNYEIKTLTSASGKPINLYYYPDWKDRVDFTYQYSKEMFDFFEKEIGYGYGWNSYSQIPVQDFLYGAMENTTATVFGDFFFVDEAGNNDRSYVGVNAHELAHQWFGDLVTARSEAHHWLQESFATHYNMIYEREVFGDEYFQWAKRTSAEKILAASEKDLLPIAHSKAGAIRHYPKGAWVLNMLRYVAGNDGYRRSIRHYLQKHAYQNVDSEDLLIAFHEKLGISLDWFWEQWIYRGGEPHYRIRFEDLGKESRFDVRQVHPVSDICGLFKMPIVFQVFYADGSSDSKTVMIENQQHTVSIPNPAGKKVEFALFDPADWILKKVDFAKPVDMLKAQALKAPFMIDRYDAVFALRKYDLAIKQEVLLKAFENEKFHAIKSEILYQIAPAITDSRVVSVFLTAFRDADMNVRKGALKALKTIPATLEAEVFAQLDAPSYELQEQALRKLCAYSPETAKKALAKTSNSKGDNALNMRIAWLELNLSQKTDPKWLSELVGYVSGSYEFRTRVSAAQTLQRLNLFNDELMKNLFDASIAYNARLSGPCLEVLRYFYAQNAFKTQIEAYYRKFIEGEPYRQEKLKSLMAE